MNRFWSLLLACACALAFAGCGEEPAPSAPTDASSTCEAESDQAFCDRVGRGSCGPLSGEDDCGETRSVVCPCPAVCGNGQREAGELCDGDCPTSCDDQEACTLDTRTGKPERCDVACLHTHTTRCTGADGCCPEGCDASNDLDCRPSCGNGAVDQGESCDGNCPASCDDAQACTLDTRSGSSSTCDVRCVHAPISACLGADGCCPSGCTAATDSDCAPSCGNGAVEAGESCDGNCPASCADQEACTTDRRTGAPQSCDVRCTHTAVSACLGADGCCPAGCTNATDSDCSPSCGNGTIEAGESCDGDCPASCDDAQACTLDSRSGSSSTCDVRCAHDAVTACAGADGCCPAGCAFPADSDCPKSCTDDCSVAGERRCSGAGVESCSPGPDGCRHWSLTQSCAACLQGACVDCSAGPVRRVRAAAAAGGDGLSWASAFRTVQQAVDSAASQAQACATTTQVWVAAGTYFLHGSGGSPDPALDTVRLAAGVEIYGGFAGTETTLAARNPRSNRTVLDGRDGPSGTLAVEHVVTGAENGVIDGFVVTGGRATASSPDPESVGGYGGGYFSLTAGAQVRNCTFVDNRGEDGGGAVYTGAWGGTDRFVNCTFLRNSAPQGGAVYASAGSRPQLVNCTFNANLSTRFAGALLANHAARPALINSILWKNPPTETGALDGATISFSHSTVFGGSATASLGNLRADPKLRILPTGELGLRSDSPCIDAGRGDQTGFAAPATDAFGQARFDAVGTPNTGLGSPSWVDMGAVEYRGEATGPGPARCVRYVDLDSTAAAPDGTSWAKAFKKVQEGIDAAYSVVEDDPEASGCEVWVAEGTYRIFDALASTVRLRPQVALLGGFAGTESAAAERDWVAHPTILDGCHQSCTVDGRVYHVVTGSDYAALDGFTVTHGNAKLAGDLDGGGMLNRSACPSVRNCVFADNIAAGNGGGVYTSCNSGMEMANCQWLDNRAVRGGGLHSSSVVVTDGLFRANRSDQGGGAYLHSGTGRFLRTGFAENWVATGKGGGLFGYFSRLELEQCSFTGNFISQVGDGGAVYNQSGSVAGTGCSFVDNSALNGHGGAVCDSSGAPRTSCTGCTYSGNYPDDLYSYP